MMPYSEPNSLPKPFFDWSEWRDAYKHEVDYFKSGAKTYSDEVLLRICLKRIGFVGINLDREIEFIKENA